MFQIPQIYMSQEVKYHNQYIRVSKHFILKCQSCDLLSLEIGIAWLWMQLISYPVSIISVGLLPWGMGDGAPRGYLR